MNFNPHGPIAAAAFAILASGCTVYQAPPPPPPRVHVQPVPPVAYVEPAPMSVVSVYVEPPVMQPPPILVGWAPPPMLVEAPPPLPYASAVWVGGYWVWEGNWVWAAGHWMAPPQPNYAWVHPYYEHRDNGVVFITGHWSPPGVVFVPPAIGLSLTLVTPLPGVIPGPRPIGPMGVFVPPPPGSRAGLVVPAPLGTPPAVVTSAPPVVNVGMRIQSNYTTTTINNTRVTNNVTIIAPSDATTTGKPFESAVPTQAHLAAALPAVVRAPAPVPVSQKPMPAFAPNRAPVALPPAQEVRPAPATAVAVPTRPAVPVTPAAAPVATQAAAASPTAAAQPSPAPVPAPPAPARPAATVERAAPVPTVHAPTASASTPAARRAAGAHDDARARPEQERKAKAEPAEHRTAQPGRNKKKEEEQKNDRAEKKSP